MSDVPYEAVDQTQEEVSADVTDMLQEFDQASLGPAQDVDDKGNPVGGQPDEYVPVDQNQGPPPPMAERPQEQPPQEQPPPQQPQEATPAPDVAQLQAQVAQLQAQAAMYANMLRGAPAPGVPTPGQPPGMATPMAQPAQPVMPGQPPAPVPQAPMPQQQPAPQATPQQVEDFLAGRDHRDMEPGEFSQRLTEYMAGRDRANMEAMLPKIAEVATATMAHAANNTTAYDNHLASKGNEWIRENQAGFDWCLQTAQNMYPHLAHDINSLVGPATEMLRAQMTQSGQPAAQPAAQPPQTPAAPRVPRVAPQAPTRMTTGAPAPKGQEQFMEEFGFGFVPEGM